ncbi:MAG: hypothetical protein WC205_16330 [Opitutaceae bacterium]|jgi:hypothetical protein
MKTRKFAAVGIIIVVIFCVVFAIYQGISNRKLHAALAVSDQRQQALMAKVQNLEQELSQTTNRLQASEKDGATLLTALDRAATGPQPANAIRVPITHDYVESRYQHAQALAKEGRSSEALEEFLWCYDEGMPQVTGYSGVRSSFLLSDIMSLGEKYPPALAALRERRDQAEKRLTASANDFDAAQGFSSINRVLKETNRTLAYFDQLPPDAPGKQSIGMLVYDQLASAQRYQEAAQAKPYKRMASFFEDIAEMPQLPSTTPGLESIRAEHRAHATKLGAGYVEVLAGAGQLTNARDLAEIIMAYDPSPEAKATLNAAVSKAGHADLFTAPPAP